MTNLEKFIEEQRVRRPSNCDQATMQHLFLELARALNADLINKPVETTKEQPKVMCYKHEAKNNKLHCSTCKNYCTITGEKIPDLVDRR